MITALPILLSAGACVAVDGDTLRCRIEGQLAGVRLLAIDAPELPGHCRKGRKCVSGDPYRAKRVLERAIRFRVLKVQPRGRDRYGRMLATVSGETTGDLSCHLLRENVAVYVRHWDTGRAVAGACPREAK